MKDPTRLVDADGTEFERMLLVAAAEERPSPLLSDRMLAGAATAGAVLALLSNAPAVGEGMAASGLSQAGGVGGAALGSATGSLAPPAAASLVGAWVVKWGVLGTLVAVLGVSGWAALGSTAEADPTRSPSGPEPRALSVPAPKTSAVSQESTPVPEEPLAAAAEPNAAPRARAARTTKSALGPEIDVLDSARRALGKGDAERALDLISSYRRRFPSGALGQEATVLEMDALAARGRTDQATDLKQQFLAEHPESAHVERVQRSGSTR